METIINKYQDQVYHFKGLWDIPSICGLKIVNKKENTIVIATDLFEENPGTSITEWNTQLAKELCDKFEIDYRKLIYIEHTPDKKTKLSFNLESFYKVNFQVIDDKFENPKWEEMSKEEVNNLITE